MCKNTKIKNLSLLFLMFLISLFFLCTQSFAKVYVKGDIYGNYCKLGILCGDKKIDVTYSKGTVYTLPTSFDRVDERKGNNCFIHLNLKSSFWGKIAKKTTGMSPVFYQYKSGPKHLITSYEKLGTPEYIRFTCF